MSRKNPNQAEEQELVEYAVEDFLEIKAALNAGKSKAAKEFLLSNGHKDFDLSAVDGILLSERLLVLSPAGLREIKKIGFLSASSGRLEVRTL